MKGVVALLLLGLAVAAPVAEQDELPGEDALTSRPHLPTPTFSLPPLPTLSWPSGSDFPHPTGRPGGPGGRPTGRPSGRPGRPTGRPTSRPHPTGGPRPTSRPHPTGRPTGRPGRPTTSSDLPAEPTDAA
ncbi:hypothetical protein F5Y13DRAFT_184197 [Hypoxylon sp. FL1857]|nr:hypothetical protein F5Y13DRAFT_184197 [Hypoxylon sp. FL1857]